MRVLIAPDSFKETLTANAAAEAIARGLRRVMPDVTVDLCPMADGGEGTVAALVSATGGQMHTTQVTGPLGEPVSAEWGTAPSPSGGGPGWGDVDQQRNVDTPSPQPSPQGRGGQMAVIEMAAAAGLHLVPTDRRDPTRTTTYGVGELILAALDAGCRKLLLGIGGSATTDGGAGMAQALGVGFTDSAACGFAQPLRGQDLQFITQVDTTMNDPRLRDVRITVACDVTNPLTGPTGAAAIYGPQKGATPQQVVELDRGLAHLAKLMNIDPDQPGFGAAGGLGFGLVAFCGAKIQRGIEIVLDAVDFDRRVQQADLVITGEGKLDGQSIQGKTCIGVAQRAARFGKPVIALVGKADDDADLCLNHGLTAYHAIVNDQITPQQAMADAARYLQELAAAVFPSYCPSTG